MVTDPARWAEARPGSALRKEALLDQAARAATDLWV
jgi:hypothetical protein